MVCFNDYRCLYSMNTFKIDGSTMRTHSSEFLAASQPKTYCSLYVKCKYSILISWFPVTGPSAMLHTDSKYHIDRTIFSNIVLSSWCYYCDVILHYCDIILYYCVVILYYCLIEMSLCCYLVQAESYPPFIYLILAGITD